MMSEGLGFIKAGLSDNAKKDSINLGLKVKLNPCRHYEFLY